MAVNSDETLSFCVAEVVAIRRRTLDDVSPIAFEAGLISQTARRMRKGAREQRRS